MTEPKDALTDEQLEAQLSAMLDNGIVLAGRTWVRPKALTFEHFNFRVNAVKDSGIAELMKQYDPQMADEDFDIFTAAFVAQASSTGALYRLLAGLLVEQDKPWSTINAMANERFFATIANAEDQRKVCEVLFWLVLDFFRNGVTSNPTIRKYLWARNTPSVVPAKPVVMPISENLKTSLPPSPTNGDAPQRMSSGV